MIAYCEIFVRNLAGAENSFLLNRKERKYWVKWQGH